MYNKDNCLSEMKSSISAFSTELKNIRTGRVSPDILKSISSHKKRPEFREESGLI